MINFYVVECTSTKKFNPLARAIMFFQKSDISHVAFVVEENGQKSTYEAVWPKAKEDVWEKFLLRYKVIRTHKLVAPTNCFDWEIRQFSRVLVQDNKHYSVLQLFLIQIQNSFTDLKHALGKVILNHKKGMICSEFVALVLSKGWGVTFNEQYDTIDLREVINQARRLAEK